MTNRIHGLYVQIDWCWLSLVLVLACLIFYVPDSDAAGATFQERCASTSVVRCVGFDSVSDISGTYGDNTGIMVGDVAPRIDSSIKSSGTGSLMFTIPSNSGSGASGAYFANFSKDLSVQFGENREFFIQWRQRFSPEFLSTTYRGGGWKQAIVGTGDQPGKLYASCTALETVVQNVSQRGFAQLYNSCTGSTSHGPYDPFQEPLPHADFSLQNARPTPYCLYSQGNTDPVSYFPPVGNCFGYFPSEWMTFQIGIRTGPRVNDEFVDSYVTLWIARENESSELAFEWGPYNLSAGTATDGQKFGKVWLLPYHTKKDSTQAHPVGYVWYDELIISTGRIPDPIDNFIRPNPPSNIAVQ